MDNNRQKESAMLRDEWARLIRVEEQVNQIRTIARLSWTLVIVMVVNVGGAIAGYATLKQQVENIDLGQFKSDISTALVVLGDHGTELSNVRTEHARLRANLDEMRGDMNDKTRERFYRSDGDRLEDRIERLENHVFTP